MINKIDNMDTESVRIDTGVLDIVRKVKEHSGIPIGRFIEEAIVLKFSKLPKKIQDKVTGVK